jgi:hypothetical protein
MAAGIAHVVDVQEMVMVLSAEKGPANPAQVARLTLGAFLFPTG